MVEGSEDLHHFLPTGVDVDVPPSNPSCRRRSASTSFTHPNKDVDGAPSRTMTMRGRPAVRQYQRRLVLYQDDHFRHRDSCCHMLGGLVVIPPSSFLDAIAIDLKPEASGMCTMPLPTSPPPDIRRRLFPAGRPDGKITKFPIESDQVIVPSRCSDRPIIRRLPEKIDETIQVRSARRRGQLRLD